ncbi:MAG: SUMF1/EgtB/PvdO family nonheme iron enzyme [Verrucomicrobia bacterium]|nr:SUMF1/EgtB/PvdO family nonheme iron enzyme [Verrucomicrobiota bacterium]
MNMLLKMILVLVAASTSTYADFVTIGGTDVAADSATSYGSVNYTYQISRYEVTGMEFGAAVAADPNVGTYGSDGANTPVFYVSWYEAVKYCNWLTSGNAYLGAYTHGGGTFAGIDRAGAISTYGTVYVLPTEDEWYKAAYWRDDPVDQWSLYANGTDTTPTWGTTSGWNYYNGEDYAYGGDAWGVGYGVQEQNGTYDMMGNVSEWTESVYDASRRVLRGGSFADSSLGVSSLTQGRGNPSDELYRNVGVRVVAVPEPSTVLLFGIGGAGAFLLRRNKRKNNELTHE